MLGDLKRVCGMENKSIFCCLAFFLFLKINAMPEMPMADISAMNQFPQSVSPFPGEQIAPYPMTSVEPVPIYEPSPMDVPPVYQPPIYPEMQQQMPSSQMPMEQIPVQAMPQMPMQQQMPMAEQMPMDIGMPAMGAQTVSLQNGKVGTQGNWVKKREWLKCSLEVNDEIQDLVDQIQQFRSSFVNKITSADNELDNFYRQVGFKQGELQAIFDGLQEYLEKKRRNRISKIKAEGIDEGVTSEMELKIDLVEDEIKGLKNSLEQFKLDMKSIEDLDQLLQDHLKKLDEQTNIAISESLRAKQLVNDIWNMIDDKKARLAYYELNGNILQKLIVLKTYVQITLLNNLDFVISTIRTQITQDRNNIVNLESNGFIIKNRAKRLEQLKLRDLEALQAGQPIQKDEVVKKEEDISENKIYNFFVGGVASIYKWYKSVINFFTGQNKHKVRLDRLQPIQPQPVQEVQVQSVMPVQPEIPLQPVVPQESIYPEEMPVQLDDIQNVSQPQQIPMVLQPTVP